MLKVAVIGLGWWGRIIVDVLANNPKLQVVRVVDIGAAGQAFAQERSLPFSPRFEDALLDPQVQGVVLCTPHTLHTDQIVAAAQAGKHVFCEKPLSMTRADVLRACAAVDRAGVALAVGHEKRFEPPILELMQLLKSGADAPNQAPLRGRIHLLDLSIGVFGEAQSVFTSVKQLGSPLTNGDTLAALVTFKRGGHALISAILATPFAGRFAVYGSQGWAEVRDKTHPEAPEGWTFTTCLRGQPIQVKDIPPAPAVLHNLEAFADAALGRAPYPVPREQMIANVSALEAVIRSAKSGQVEPVQG